MRTRAFKTVAFWVRCGRRGTAAVEFAIIVPVLLLILGSLVDYSRMFWSKGLLASSIAQGAEYAFVVGPTVTSANVQTVVRRTLPTASVVVTGPSCYCVTGTPATVISQSCGTTCTNQIVAGTFVRISATYTYSSVMPLQSKLVDPVLQETVMVRLK